MSKDKSFSEKSRIFKKKFKGVVYALGTPYFNDSTQILSIKNFEFDIKSRDALVGTAEWILKSSLRNKIEERLNFPLQDQLEKAQKSADEALNNAKIPGMKLKGKVIADIFFLENPGRLVIDLKK